MQTQQIHDPELEAWLRAALSGAGDGFDSAALSSGARRRSEVVRRRQVLSTAAATGMAALALAALWQGADALGTAPVQQVPPAAPAPQVPALQVPAPQVPVTQAPGVQDPGPTPEPTEQAGPPWQDHAPPTSPSDGSLSTGTGAWDIPDPRPTGVAFLDELGPPRLYLEGTNLMPLPGWMRGNDWGNPTGRKQVAGLEWGFYGEGSNAIQPAVDIAISGWDDGAAAMADFRADRLSSTHDTAGGRDLTPAPWPGHEGESDFFAARPFAWGRDTTYAGRFDGAAVVRTGDYLVGVSVTAGSPELASGLAREIAAKTADNLAVLDPEHGEPETGNR